ncbi:hypothetical protein M8542_47940 [Amycolatopsis sp. OK19-0408]|uniref:STAS domain-containing protein n=1 Tax=Amycolatopsis iheyensis TaxID=2945988 RepID=A0A9X2NQG4_9PSEU|nr:hypothetical protein [Amycolatopsis iheyensis]MCR6490560.1 hypothetical protein [Amycolatopsis iheyensis]
MRAVTDSRTGPRLLVRTTVADGIILLTVAGTVGNSAPDAFVDELTEACLLCAGVVIVDVRCCEIKGRMVADLVCDVVHRTRGRCRVQVITADREIADACFAVGVSCTQRPSNLRAPYGLAVRNVRRPEST